MAHDVFISHSAHDKAVADEVCSSLENSNVRCWVAPRDVRPGRSFAGEITRAIQQSKVMVLVFSEHSNRSQQVLREVQLAVESNLHILQFRIENVVLNDDLRYFLGTPHWLDALTPPLQKHLKRLESATKELLGQPAMPLPATEPETAKPDAIAPPQTETAPPEPASPREMPAPSTQADDNAGRRTNRRKVLLTAVVAFAAAILITFSWLRLSSRNSNPISPQPSVIDSAQNSANLQASPPGLSQAEKDYELGLQYFRGGGTVLIDQRKSFELIERAAKQGLPEAEAELAVRLKEGGLMDLIFPPEDAKASEWANKAIADGLEAKAQRAIHSAEFGLASLYLIGLGVSKDEAKAREWYESAANHGEVDAKRALGFLYFSGAGVPRDMIKAKSYFEEAAAANIAGAHIFLGLIYKSGDGEIAKDPAKAFACFKRAADLGQASAYINLAELYKEGLGVPKDPVKAFECNQKASDREMGVAIGRVAESYEKGDGVQKNLSKAEELYKKLAERGSKVGIDGLERVRALSPESLKSPKPTPQGQRSRP